MLIKRDVILCSTLVQEELDHLKHTYININNYPAKVVEDIITEEKERFVSGNGEQNTKVDHNPDISQVQIILPYAGKRGNQMISKMKKIVKDKLPRNGNVRVSFTSRKLGTWFPVKDRTKFGHNFNCTYYNKCLNDSDGYTGETDRRIGE